MASQTREQNREAVAKKYNLPEADIRDTVTISQLLYRQIERCNQAGGSNESLNFEGCVDVLFQMVPNNVRTAVVHRVKDYKQTTERPVYKTNAGVQMGTIEHPVRLPDGSIWSPIMEKSEFIDYRLLFNIIMQELESAKITWRYDSMTMELGKVDEVEIEIPVETQERAKLFLEDLTRKDNATGYIYTYWELCKKITPDVPPPTPGREGYKGTNADFDVDDNEDITEGTEPLKQEEEEESDMEIEQGEEKNE